MSSSLRHSEFINVNMSCPVFAIPIQPSAAVTLGALLEHKLDVQGKHVGIILCGGNVDLDQLPWQHAPKHA